jgi:integrase
VFKQGRIWWVKFAAHGKTIRESSGTTVKADAITLLNRRLGELGRGKRFSADADKLTVGTMFQTLVNDYRIKGNRTRPKLKHLCRAFDVIETDGVYSGGWKALEVTTARIRAYEAERLADGAARATVNQELAMLRRAFRLNLEPDGPLATMPGIKTPDPHNARKGFLSDDQFKAVRDKLREEFRGVWEFCYRTGWRIQSEVLRLRWRDNVDWKLKVVRIHDSKNGEPREFPFDVYPELTTLLERQLASGEPVSSPWVFHQGGRPITYKVWNNNRRMACTEAGVGAITHDLRRTAVRNLQRAGVSRSVAMSLTGHKTSAVYGRYAIVDSSAQREGVAKLARQQAESDKAAVRSSGER